MIHIKDIHNTNTLAIISKVVFECFLMKPTERRFFI